MRRDTLVVFGRQTWFARQNSASKRQEGCYINMRSKRRNDDDYVAEGIWLTADAINQLLHNRPEQETAMNETMWKCDQLRAGKLYNRMMFDTQVEAEQFMQKMRQMEPDQMFSIEAIAASQVWN